MTLRRADGRIYLDRWGLGVKRLGAVYLHRMAAPDPGVDLHDHPWTFISIVLVGHYAEERAPTRDAVQLARRTEETGAQWGRGYANVRKRWSMQRLRLDECHRVVHIYGGRPCWTLVLCGPVRRRWGFYMADGFLDERAYDETVRADRRDLWNEVGS